MTQNSALTAPKGLVLVNGQHYPRRMGYVTSGAPLVCRKRHRFIEPVTEILDGVGGYVCRRRDGDGPCGWVVCIIEGSGAGSFRADLTSAEWTEIVARRWRASHVLEYVGASLMDEGAA